MNVLYLGTAHPSSTSRHRAEALKRLGCEVDLHDPTMALGAHGLGLLAAMHYRTGYLMTRPLIDRWLATLPMQRGPYDLCWIDGGELLSASALRRLRSRCARLVLFNHDDPSGPRDSNRFMTLRRALPSYDLCVVVRSINVTEFKALGARDVIRVWMSYDEVAHRPAQPSRPVKAVYDNDIAFIGRRMKGEGRDRHMLALIEQGLKPAIWGDNWQSSSDWHRLAPYWRGAGLAGQDYVDAIRGAKICIGMLSKGNRDQHTTRTMEIPAAGGLLCAERTDEHLALYREDEEAVFWSSPQECVAQCKRLLADQALLHRIRQAGQRRVISNGVGSEDICRTVFTHLQLA